MVNVEKQIHTINNTTYKGVYGLSVSKCLDMLKKDFNKDIASVVTKQKHFDDIDSAYYHMQPDDILAMWKQKAETSISYGNKLDDYVGIYISRDEMKIATWKHDNNFENDVRLASNIKGFEQFWDIVTNVLGYHYVTREQPLYIASQDEGHIINGRFDCLFYNPDTNKYMIIDWKTNEKITTENKFNKMLGPCFKLPQTDLNRYTIQVYFYKKAFLETYEICEEPNIIDAFICKLETAPTESGNYFTLMKPSFEYNSDFLDKCINFAVKRNKEKEAEKRIEQARELEKK